MRALKKSKKTRRTARSGTAKTTPASLPICPPPITARNTIVGCTLEGLVMSTVAVMVGKEQLMCAPPPSKVG